MPEINQVILTVLETSDLHGSLLPIQYATNAEAGLGFAKAATLIRERQSRDEHVIYLDNGDLIQGTPLSYYHARIDNSPPDPMVEALNRTGCDAAVIGNHEFNYGMDVLGKAVRESAFPWLSANVVDKATGEPFFGKPYVVKSFSSGVKAAVLGVTTHYIPHWENPSHIEQLRFEDALETTKRWVRHIRETERPDVMIVSYHGGFEADPGSGAPTESATGENQGHAICMEVPGIDVLLTGHQHRTIAGEAINGVTIVQPGHQGRYVGIVTVCLERAEAGGSWRIADKRSELIPVEAAVPCEDLLGMAIPYEERTQAWLDQPIGRLVGDMRIADPLQARTEDHPLIEFINRVQMDAAGVAISNTALFDNESRGFSDRITMREVVSNYIYPNTLKVIRVSGRDIREALEQTARYFASWGEGRGYEVSAEFSSPKPQHYNYDMWEGIEYELNVSRPPGQRVTKLLMDGQQIDPDRQFDVVMNNYRAGGGGNYFMFQGKPVVRDIPTDVSELIANYILERGEIVATVNGNWRVVRDSGEGM